MHGDAPVCLAAGQLTRATQGLPLADEVGEPFDVVGAVLGCVGVVGEHAVDGVLLERLLDVFADGDPL